MLPEIAAPVIERLPPWQRRSEAGLSGRVGGRVAPIARARCIVRHIRRSVHGHRVRPQIPIALIWGEEIVLVPIIGRRSCVASCLLRAGMAGPVATPMLAGMATSMLPASMATSVL